MAQRPRICRLEDLPSVALHDSVETFYRKRPPFLFISHTYSLGSPRDHGVAVSSIDECSWDRIGKTLLQSLSILAKLTSLRMQIEKLFDFASTLADAEADSSPYSTINREYLTKLEMLISSLRG